MITFKYNCGFWFVYLNGAEVANTGTETLDRARQAGFKPTVAGGTLEPVCRLLGPEYVAAFEAWLATQPKPRKLTKAEQAAQHRRMLKGF